MTPEEKLLSAKTEDIVRLCEKYSCGRFSDFLDGGEAAFIETEFHFPYGCNYMLFGGFDGCERKLLGVFPEWEEACESAFPISVLRIDGGFNRRLTHRDYLGTVLSLGLDRRKIGDILADNDGAYLFVCSDTAQYIKDNIRKIGNQGVKITEIALDGFEAPKRETEHIETVFASARLDAAVSAAAGLSRSEASKLIEGGLVKLNYKEIYDTSKTVKEGDLLSVRGHGRYVLSEIGDETRKGRIHAVFEKYS